MGNVSFTQNMLLEFNINLQNFRHMGVEHIWAFPRYAIPSILHR